MNISTYRPSCVVTFYTEKGNLVARGTNQPNSKLDDDIVSVNTSRLMGADAPTFSITLVNRRAWHRWVTPNDYLTINMCRPPEKDATIFGGLVEDIRKNVVMNSDGTPQRVITITGRGVAKAFIQFDSGIVPEAEVATPTLGWLVSNGVTLGGATCKDIIQAIWDNICKKFVNYSWDNGKKLFDLISLNLTNKDGMILLDDTNLVNWQGSLHALIKEIAEAPFYESFWETDNSKPILYIRPTPFDAELWNKLPTCTMRDEDIVLDNTGRSDIETYTIFSVGAKTLFASNDPYKTLGTLPLWYKPYADKYGIRRLHVNSNYTATANAQDSETNSDKMRKLQTDVFNWNIKNNAMYNGSILARGQNYKVGTRLKYISVEDNSTIEYYITGINQNFVNFGSWTSELQVTRGLKPEDRFTAPYGASAEYSGLGLTKFDPAAAKAWRLGGNDSSSYGTYGGDPNAIVQGAITEMNSGRIRYVFGADNPTSGALDCSSFTKYVFKKYGSVDIGRTTGEQVDKGSPVESKSNLQPGDLILFKDTYASGMKYGASHVGIHVSNGNFIHNSSGAGTVIQSNLSNSYYSEHFLMGRRIVTASAPVGGSASATSLDKALGGSLKGHGQDYITYGSQYNVSPVLAAAISMQETGNGKYCSYNNVGGMMGSGGLMHFSSITEGIKSHIHNLRVNYFDDGLTTIEQIGARYAPIGAGNDPNGLNGNWVPGVKSFMKQLSGQ